MSELTGYITSSGLDLSYVFLRAGQNGLTNVTKTKFITSTNTDLGNLFSPYVSSDANCYQAPLTGLLLSNNLDLNERFDSIIKWSACFSPTIVFSPITGWTVYFFRVKIIDLNHVYIIGNFLSVNNIAGTSNITMFDGSNYTALGSGISFSMTSVNTIMEVAMDAYDNSHVYVGGGNSSSGVQRDILQVSGVGNHMLMWNGSDWSPMCHSANVLEISCIYALDPSHVYVGGVFSSIKSFNNITTTTNSIAMWNGSTFSALSGITINGLVSCIYALDPSHVYVGGTFTTSGGATNIAMWNGSTFSSLLPTNNLVSCIYALDPSHVYFGGTFTTVNSISTKGFAMWNGTTVPTMPTGVQCNATCIYAVDPSHVYVGGQMYSTVAQGFMMWNGINFKSLRNGTNNLGGGTGRASINYMNDIIYVSHFTNSISAINGNSSVSSINHTLSWG